MLISRVHVVMKCYRLESGSIGCKGNVLNLEQNIQKTFNSLPLSASELPIVILRKNSINNTNGFKDFKARRWAIRKWLIFLKNNNALYNDIEINEANLSLIPVNGDMSSHINYLDIDEEIEDEINNEDEGIEQGNATGNLSDNEDDEKVNCDYAFENHLVKDRKATVSSILEDRLRKREGERDNTINLNNTEDISHRDSNITAWHDINDAPLSDYNHPHIQALAFPTLFPFGDGDATNRDRRKYISMTDSNKHLLKYCIKDNLLN